MYINIIIVHFMHLYIWYLSKIPDLLLNYINNNCVGKNFLIKYRYYYFKYILTGKCLKQITFFSISINAIEINNICVRLKIKNHIRASQRHLIKYILFYVNSSSFLYIYIIMSKRIIYFHFYTTSDRCTILCVVYLIISYIHIQKNLKYI